MPLMLKTMSILMNCVKAERGQLAFKILGQVFVVLFTKRVMQNMKCNQIFDARQKIIDKTTQNDTTQTFKKMTHSSKERKPDQ